MTDAFLASFSPWGIPVAQHEVAVATLSTGIASYHLLNNLVVICAPGHLFWGSERGRESCECHVTYCRSNLPMELVEVGQ